MFERSEARSPAWRIFAVFTFVFAFPVLTEGLGVDHGWPLAKSVIGMIGLIGLLGYAYGIRIGPRLFWAGFATFFSVGLMIGVGRQIAIRLSLAPGMPVPGRLSAEVLGLGLAIALLVCLALFRQGGLFAGGDDAPRTRRHGRKAVAYGKVFD